MTLIRRGPCIDMCVCVCIFMYFMFYFMPVSVSRETMERCSALYAEVQRSVGRLARVCERRKAQLEKHLLSPPSLPTASQENCDDVVDDRTGRNGTNHSLSACRQVRKKSRHSPTPTMRPFS